METAVTVNQKRGSLEKAQDLVGDVFGVQLTETQFAKLLALHPGFGVETEEIGETEFADIVCKHFVGRGIPWRKEPSEAEYGFWQQVKCKENEFRAFIGEEMFC